MFARSSQLSPNSFRRNGVIAFHAPDVADYHSRDVAFVNIGRDLLIRSWLVRDEDHRDDRRQNSGLVAIDSRSEIELNFQPNTDILCNRARFIITYLSIGYIHKKFNPRFFLFSQSKHPKLLLLDDSTGVTKWRRKRKENWPIPGCRCSAC